MKIIKLTAENLKKISAVEITPDGNLVQITGKNGQGKSTVLDAIAWAIQGERHIQSQPIRLGQDRAQITLDLGAYRVIRTFSRREDGEHTTSVRVEAADGARYSGPQALLNSFMEALTFDPLAFARLKPEEQFDMLRRFVPDVDFDAIAKASKADFDARTAENRDAKRFRAAAEAIVVPADLPAEPIDETALVSRLERAGETNAAIVGQKERRRATRQRLADLTTARVQMVDEHPRDLKNIEASRDRFVADLRRQIEELTARIAETELAAESRIALLDHDHGERLKGIDEEIGHLRTELGTELDLPEPVDTAALRQQIEAARATNAALARRAERDRHLAEAEAAEARSKALTQAMEDREAAKREAIAKADLPVPGIGFGAGIITLNGLPFDQASSAEQLRAGVALAMATDPKLRVIRVREGSLLDDDALMLLAEEAERHDCQVWIERVDSSGTIGFVMEDGHLQGVEPPPPEERAQPVEKPKVRAAKVVSAEVAQPEKEGAPTTSRSSRWNKPAAQTGDLLA